MIFDHEKLDVYRVSVAFVAWSYRLAKTLKGPDRHAREQLLRASQSIPLNIAEGNGKRPGPDRIRYFHIAYGSALECSAILDVLNACDAVTPEELNVGKEMLHRTVAMLIRLTQKPDRVQESDEAYGLKCVAYECE